MSLGIGVLVAAVLLFPAGPAKAAFEVVDQWEFGEDAHPEGVATDTADNLFVVESYPDQVHKFSSNGNQLTSWENSDPYEDRRSDGFIGIAADTENNVYVAEATYRCAGRPEQCSQGSVNVSRVQKFDSSGGFQMTWGELGDAEGELAMPAGIAADSQDRIYVLEPGFAGYCGEGCGPTPPRVQKFDSDGGYLTEWGSEGSGDGQFNYPRSVATDTDDDVYVADTGNNRVQKFDSAGNFLAKWGLEGLGNGAFRGSPDEIATDSEDNVYVGESACGRGGCSGWRVQKFDSSGNYLAAWARDGSCALEGLATDSVDHIYVTQQCEGFWRYFAVVEKFTELPPDTTIDSGPSGRTSDATPTFNFSSDADGAEFQCRINGAAFEPCASAFTTEPLADGDHTLEVRAVDSAGSIDETPASRSFTVDTRLKGWVAANQPQAKLGPRTTIRIRLGAKEDLTAKAKGKVKINPTYRLKPKRAKLTEGERFTLKLRPNKRKHAEKIAKALKKGKKATAKFKVKLSDEAGNKKTTKLKVKLKR